MISNTAAIIFITKPGVIKKHKHLRHILLWLGCSTVIAEYQLTEGINVIYIGCKILEQATVQVFGVYRISFISAMLKVCTDTRRRTRFQAKQFQTYAIVTHNVQKLKQHLMFC
jgi:hypothetical protein